MSTITGSSIDRNAIIASDLPASHHNPTRANPSSSDEFIDRVVGKDSMGDDIHSSDLVFDSTDAEFLARMDAEEASERRRLADTYHPTAADLAEYDEWLASIDDGPEPYVVSTGHTFDEWDAIRLGQVTGDELAQLAAHGCV